MLHVIWSTIFAASLIALSFAMEPDYGIGFDLALDYGVVSIYFSNGTIAPVAKIQGSPAYRRDMRTALNVDSIIVDSTGDQIPTMATNSDPIIESQAQLAIQSLRDHLPPWLGGRVDPRVQSLSWMLKALKQATESYLETSISTIAVSFPFPITKSAHQALFSTISSLSLKTPSPYVSLSGISAALAYGIGHECIPYPSPGDPEMDPAQLILTVQYTRAGLTASILEERCRIFEYKRVMHLTKLGLDERSLLKNPYDELSSALLDITKLPLPDDRNVPTLKDISQLVLIGEAADDRLLQDVLRKVLIHFNSTQLLTSSTVDPVFAASIGTAENCWDRIESQRDEL